MTGPHRRVGAGHAVAVMLVVLVAVLVLAVVTACGGPAEAFRSAGYPPADVRSRSPLGRIGHPPPSR
jgi:hypothetical protein